MSKKDEWKVEKRASNLFSFRWLSFSSSLPLPFLHRTHYSRFLCQILYLVHARIKIIDDDDYEKYSLFAKYTYFLLARLRQKFNSIIGWKATNSQRINLLNSRTYCAEVYAGVEGTMLYTASVYVLPRVYII